VRHEIRGEREKTSFQGKKDGFFCCFVENVLILHLSSKKTFYSKTNLTDLL
jgi:hypothetical protein